MLEEFIHWYFERVGDIWIGSAILGTSMYIPTFVVRKWLVIWFKERRGLNTIDIKKMLLNIAFILAWLAGLIIFVRFIKVIHLSASMTTNMSFGAFMFFSIPLSLNKDFVR